METTIQKWGNSQGLRLEKSLLKEAGFKTGMSVRVSVRDNTIIIRKVSSRVPSLEELVAKIPKDYVHKHEDLFGKPVGKEVW